MPKGRLFPIKSRFLSWRKVDGKLTFLVPLTVAPADVTVNLFLYIVVSTNMVYLVITR